MTAPTQTQVACWQRVHLLALIRSARAEEIRPRADSLMGPQMQAVGPRPVRVMYAGQMDGPLVFSLSANRLRAVLGVSVRPRLIAGPLLGLNVKHAYCRSGVLQLVSFWDPHFPMATELQPTSKEFKPGKCIFLKSLSSKVYNNCIEKK